MAIKNLVNHSSNFLQTGTQRISANWKDHKVAMICGLAVTVLSAGAGFAAVGVGLALSPLGISSLLVSGIALGLLMQVSFRKPENSHPFDAKLIPSNQTLQLQIEKLKEAITEPTQAVQQKKSNPLNKTPRTENLISSAKSEKSISQEQKIEKIEVEATRFLRTHEFEKNRKKDQQKKAKHPKAKIWEAKKEASETQRIISSQRGKGKSSKRK